MKSVTDFSRRDVLSLGRAALVSTVPMTILSAAAGAKPKFLKTQTAGFFRLKVGTYEVTIVSDGALTFPTSNFGTNRPEAEIKAFLKANFRDSEEHYAHTNLCLINTGEKLVMVDAGSGFNFQKSAGQVLNNLAAAGIKPEDIDTIIISHCHPDHIWGIIDDETGKPRFPNADYVINGVEWDYWTKEDLASTLPKSFAPVALGARRNLLPVSAKTKRMKAGEDVLPGITLVDTPGHTVGHVSVLVTSQEESLLILADVVHHAFLSFDHPEWHFRYDADPELGSKTRRKLLDMAATDRLLCVGYHLPFPGVGYVARNGKSFRFVPDVWRWSL